MLNPQIETFIKVAASGSFSKAADEMYITPTAVMKQINALEGRLGVPLFGRTSQGLTLTAAGKSLLDDAVYMSDYAARAIEKARDIDRSENHQTIRVGVSFMTPARFILDIWSQIQSAAPHMHIELIPFENTPENAREILKNLGAHIDIVAGMYDERLQSERGFRVLHLYDKPLLFAVSVTSCLAAKETLELSDLRESGVFLIKKGWNRFIDSARDLLAEQQIEVKDFEFFNVNAYNRAVQTDTPIITIGDWENVHPLLVNKKVNWDCTAPYGIMYAKEPSKQVQKFIKVVQSIVR